MHSSCIYIINLYNKQINDLIIGMQYIYLNPNINLEFKLFLDSIFVGKSGIQIISHIIEKHRIIQLTQPVFFFARGLLQKCLRNNFYAIGLCAFYNIFYKILITSFFI